MLTSTTIPMLLSIVCDLSIMGMFVKDALDSRLSTANRIKSGLVASLVLGVVLLLIWALTLTPKPDAGMSGR